jgi:hypothetical protein
MMGSKYEVELGIATNIGSRYRVTGWTLLPANNTTSNRLMLDYDVTFERLDKEPWTTFVEHPKANELDDYKVYRLIINEEKRKLQNSKRRHKLIHQEEGLISAQNPESVQDVVRHSYLN